MNRELVEAATVELPENGGQGVLIAGGFIATAAHCVKWLPDCSMTIGSLMGEGMFQTVVAKQGLTFRCCAVFVDPVSDIAVLGAADSQVLPEDADLFEQFQAGVQPVEVASRMDEIFQPFPICVLSHERKWLDGTGKFCDLWRRSVHLEMQMMIEKGTSGGPVVDELGDLVGVVSIGGNMTGEGASSFGHIATLSRTLPVWLSELLKRARTL